MIKRLALQTIRIYRTYITPYKTRCCRFEPTCSQYGKEAIETFGLARGLLMTIARILRCSPFSRGGYDPIPIKRCANKKEQNIWKKGY